MSSNPQISIEQLEQTRKQINRLVEEIARLSETDLSPFDYYGEFLQRVLTAVAAPAGAVWVRTPQGHLQLQYQINIRQAGLEVPEPLQIPRAFARCHEILQGVRHAGGRGRASDQVLQRRAASGEEANAGGIVRGGVVLLLRYPLGFADWGMWVVFAARFDSRR